jgi:hypothetical protein
MVAQAQKHRSGRSHYLPCTVQFGEAEHSSVVSGERLGALSTTTASASPGTATRHSLTEDPVASGRSAAQIWQNDREEVRDCSCTRRVQHGNLAPSPATATSSASLGERAGTRPMRTTMDDRIDGSPTVLGGRVHHQSLPYQYLRTYLRAGLVWGPVNNSLPVRHTQADMSGPYLKSNLLPSSAVGPSILPPPLSFSNLNPPSTSIRPSLP